MDFVEFAFHAFNPITGVLNADVLAATDQFPLNFTSFIQFAVAHAVVDFLDTVRNNVQCTANECIKTKCHPAANSCIAANQNLTSIAEQFGGACNVIASVVNTTEVGDAFLDQITETDHAYCGL